MKVSELMTREVITIDGGETLAEAARRMWDYDCGVLPLVSAMGTVTGMITDRDICQALAKGKPVSQTPVQDVASRKVYATAPDDDVETALQTMKAHQVRRLPVIDRDGRLIGLLSMNDVVLHAGGFNGVRELAIVDALKGICAHQHVQAA